MRKPTPPFVFPNDDDLADAGDLGACPGAGLCCPDDPLDKVLGYVSALDDGFLDDLGLDWSLPADDAGKAREATEPATGAPAAPCEADAPGDRKSGAGHVFDSVPEGPPPPQAPSFSCSPASSGRRSLTPTSGAAEPRELASGDDLRWTVLKRPHHRGPPRRRRDDDGPYWTPALPLALTSPAAEDYDNDEKDRDFELMTFCNSGGGNGLPRPGAGQKRQRKRGSKNGKEKTCAHCRATDTPQWRAGPDGNGTLCNACGIRYKMGKLCQEYRPFSSPDFSSDEHSNRHRNVERIRQRKKLKVMAPQVPLNLDADDKDNVDKLLLPLPVCKYEK